MAQVNVGRTGHGGWSNQTERDAALWAIDLENMRRDFEGKEQQEHDGLLNSRAAISASYEANRRDMAAHLPRGSAERIEEMLGRSQAAEVELLQRNYDLAKTKRAEQHGEAMARHFKKFPSSGSANKVKTAPSKYSRVHGSHHQLIPLTLFSPSFSSI